LAGASVTPWSPLEKKGPSHPPTHPYNRRKTPPKLPVNRRDHVPEPSTVLCPLPGSLKAVLMHKDGAPLPPQVAWEQPLLRLVLLNPTPSSLCFCCWAALLAQRWRQLVLWSAAHVHEGDVSKPNQSASCQKGKPHGLPSNRHTRQCLKLA
jgi:hypothetical protein